MKLRLYIIFIPFMVYTLLCDAVRSLIGNIPTNALAPAVLLDNSIANTIADTGVYGLTSQAVIPAGNQSLWHVIKALFYSIAPSNTEFALLLLNYLCGLGVIYLLTRTAFRWFQQGMAALCTGLAAACLPILTQGVSLTESNTLLCLLVVYAITKHVAHVLDETAPPLSLGTALPLGLASCITPHVWVFWFGMALHAFWAALWSKRLSLQAVFIRFISGLLLISACMWPIVQHNLRFFNVPLIAPLDAGISLNDLAGSAGEQTGNLITSSLGSSIVRTATHWFQSPLGISMYLVVLATFSAIFLFLLSIKQPRHKPMLFFFLIPMVAIAGAGIITGFIGLKGSSVSLGITTLILTLYFGVLGLSFYHLLKGLFTKISLPSSPFMATATSMILMLFMVILPTYSMGKNRIENKKGRALERQSQEHYVKNTLQERFTHTPQIASDNMAMLLPEFSGLDLTGTYSPETLFALEPGGNWNQETFHQLLDQRNIEALVIWQPSHAFFTYLTQGNHRYLETLTPPTGSPSIVLLQPVNP